MTPSSKIFTQRSSGPDLPRYSVASLSLISIRIRPLNTFEDLGLTVYVPQQPIPVHVGISEALRRTKGSLLWIQSQDWGHGSYQMQGWRGSDTELWSPVGTWIQTGQPTGRCRSASLH